MSCKVIDAMKKPDCVHNPSPNNSFSKRFTHYLFHKNDLLDRCTNTSYCAKCGSFLHVPTFYTSSILKIIYSVLAAFLEWMCIQTIKQTSSPVLYFFIGQLVVVFFLLLLLRIVSSIVLSLAIWTEEEQVSDLRLKYRNDPTGHQIRTCESIICGIIICFAYFCGMNINILLFMLSVINIFFGLVHRKKISIGIGAIVTAYSVVSLLWSNLESARTFLVIGDCISFLLYFLTLYSLLYLQDSKKK